MFIRQVGGLKHLLSRFCLFGENKNISMCLRIIVRCITGLTGEFHCKWFSNVLSKTHIVCRTSVWMEICCFQTNITRYTKTFIITQKDTFFTDLNQLNMTIVFGLDVSKLLYIVS